MERDIVGPIGNASVGGQVAGKTATSGFKPILEPSPRQGLDVILSSKVLDRDTDGSFGEGLVTGKSAPIGFNPILDPSVKAESPSKRNKVLERDIGPIGNASAGGQVAGKTATSDFKPILEPWVRAKSPAKRSSGAGSPSKGFRDVDSSVSSALAGGRWKTGKHVESEGPGGSVPCSPKRDSVAAALSSSSSSSVPNSRSQSPKKEARMISENQRPENLGSLTVNPPAGKIVAVVGGGAQSGSDFAKKDTEMQLKKQRPDNLGSLPKEEEKTEKKESVSKKEAKESASSESCGPDSGNKVHKGLMGDGGGDHANCFCHSKRPNPEAVIKENISVMELSGRRDSAEREDIFGKKSSRGATNAKLSVFRL